MRGALIISFTTRAPKCAGLRAQLKHTVWGCAAITQLVPHVQVWDVKQEDAARTMAIQDAGHQSGIRAAALSGDDTLLLTVAAEGVKVCAGCSASHSAASCQGHV